MIIKKKKKKFQIEKSVIKNQRGRHPV